MKGKLYGIGTGPGDPELLTLKAISTIQKCQIIAVPKTSHSERTAFSIIEEYLDGKELLDCRFAMDKDISKREEARQIVASRIIECLDCGKDVGFITLGDPTTYSTYMYVHKIVANKGYNAEIIPGITSYTAAASELGIALCEGNEILTLIPSGHEEPLNELLDNPGTKVLMKSGKNLSNVLKALKAKENTINVKIACRATMKNQRLYSSIEEYENSPEAGYFTLVIVKENE